jgi:cyclic-di-GMP-binding protein
MDLVRAIHQDLSTLQNFQLPKDGSIPADANHDDYIYLLTYLIKHWGITPKRFFNRSPKNGELELVTGIFAIHHASDNNAVAINQTNAHDGLTLNTVNVVQATPSRWQILNISATGMSIRRHPTAEKNIRIGSLLGIKTKSDQHWSLGVVRWASCGHRERLDMGVQLIAPQAQGAIARVNGVGHDEMVLLLPQISAVKQPVTLVAPKGTYNPARQLTLTYKNESKRIMLTKLIERSHHFERIQFSVIS